MSITTTSRLTRRETVQSEALPDGSGLLFDTQTATAYPITESAARIWNLCDGARSVADIVTALEEHYDVDRETVEADSLKLIAELVDKELLAEVAGSPSP